MLLWKADQHQQSQPKMFPLQLENQASLLPPPQPTQKASVTKSIKRSIKCPNTFPNRAVTWCIIRRKRKQQAPGCIMVCVHIRIICATSQGVEIGAEHLNPLTISNKKSHFSLCSLHLQTETDRYSPTSLSVCFWYLPRNRVVLLRAPWCCSKHIAPKVPSDLLVLVRLVSATGRRSPSPGQGLLVTQEPTHLTEQPGFKSQGYCVPHQSPTSHPAKLSSSLSSYIVCLEAMGHPQPRFL